MRPVNEISFLYDRIGTKTFENGPFVFPLRIFCVRLHRVSSNAFTFFGLLQMGFWYCVVGDLHAR